VFLPQQLFVPSMEQQFKFAPFARQCKFGEYRAEGAILEDKQSAGHFRRLFSILPLHPFACRVEAECEE
jgi:hypothetical protein